MTQRDHDNAAMFDRIARRYDLLNRVLSFGTDVWWRRRALRLAELAAGTVVLDVGAGTGDLAIAAGRRGARAIGLDPSPGMLAVARARAPRTLLVIARAEAIPLPDASVDRVLSGFTARNIGDLPAALGEIHRVLRPGGRAVILELSHPTPRAFARVYSFYFERVAPRLAALLGGDVTAYRYLPASLRPFPRPEPLAQLLRAAGFARVSFERLSFGIAAIHVAER